MRSSSSTASTYAALSTSLLRIRLVLQPNHLSACLQVKSFGVNGHVKLPGAGPNTPNVYDFGTTYSAIHDDLQRKDEALYSRKGLLQVTGTSSRTAAHVHQSTKGPYCPKMHMR